MSVATHRLIDTSHWRPLQTLAALLVYPDDSLGPHTATCRRRLAGDEPTLLGMVEDSLRFIATQPRHILEELYTQTFDLNPVSTLEVGWHLYGEQYERGRFLVRARQMLSQVGQDEGGELPDFLPSLLCALPRLPEDEAIDLAAYLLPAVGAMCDALAAKDANNPYHAILVAVRQALTTRVPEDAVAKVENSRPRPHAPPPGLVQIGAQREKQP